MEVGVRVPEDAARAAAAGGGSGTVAAAAGKLPRGNRQRFALPLAWARWLAAVEGLLRQQLQAHMARASRALPSESPAALPRRARGLKQPATRVLFSQLRATAPALCARKARACHGSTDLANVTEELQSRLQHTVLEAVLTEQWLQLRPEDGQRHRSGFRGVRHHAQLLRRSGLPLSWSILITQLRAHPWVEISPVTHVLQSQLCAVPRRAAGCMRGQPMGQPHATYNHANITKPDVPCGKPDGGHSGVRAHPAGAEVVQRAGIPRVPLARQAVRSGSQAFELILPGPRHLDWPKTSHLIFGPAVKPVQTLK